MRKVYTPPKTRGGGVTMVLGSVVITLLVFLVLPLTQMLSSHIQRKQMLTRVDTAVLEQPDTDPEEPPPEPEPEEDPPEPEPTLDDLPQQMDLNFNLDVAVGEGGALKSLMSGEFMGGGEALKDMAFSMSELDKEPVLMASPSPKYPPDMRKNKIEGSVSILFVLNKEGRVEDPRVETSNRPEFEKPALEAVRHWKFKPGLKDGKPVRTHMRLPLRFRIST